ncbi:hypothetical protein VHEMI10428 [[Torrubiella] hemipterigena]|uniref:Uncharacterized protein n=1 Tax=[Torrubiella] hemipterigena TaxID=1531966 RepID=A0A0A1TCZ5_9HYPO|nr:hypothetical protein VHEMI10428 [[Torrubiella] hemipterigena]
MLSTLPIGLLLAGALSAVAIELPKECQVPNPVITDFKWFNGSSSLRCNSPNAYTRGYYCYNSTLANPWLEPIDHNTCIDVQHGYWVYPCADSSIPQNPPPWGHGPGEVLQFAYKDGETCRQGVSGGYHNYNNPGQGLTACRSYSGGLGFGSSFWGSSNEATSQGRFARDLNYGYAPKCTNGSRIAYHAEGPFTLTCTHDEFKNATCTAEPFEIPITSYTIIDGY